MALPARRPAGDGCAGIERRPCGPPPRRSAAAKGAPTGTVAMLHRRRLTP